MSSEQRTRLTAMKDQLLAGFREHKGELHLMASGFRTPNGDDLTKMCALFVLGLLAESESEVYA